MSANSLRCLLADPFIYSQNTIFRNRYRIAIIVEFSILLGIFPLSVNAGYAGIAGKPQYLVSSILLDRQRIPLLGNVFAVTFLPLSSVAAE